MAPDLELYYLSAQGHYAAHWATIFLNPGVPPPDIKEREANAALHMMTKSPHTHHNSIDPTKVTVTAWAKLADIYGKDSLYQPSMPIWGDPQSPFTLDGEVALHWSSRGISQWGQLFPEKTFVEWEAIRDMVGNTNTHKTQYMRVKARVQRIFPSFPTEPVMNMGLGYMVTGGIQKITAAALYKVIMQTRPMGIDGQEQVGT